MSETPLNTSRYPTWLSHSFFALVFFTCISSLIFIASEDMQNSDSLDTTYSYESGSCNVSAAVLRGRLHTYLKSSGEEEGSEYTTSADDILYAIENAKIDDSIQAFILEVDSYGGMPVAGEEIAVALRDLGKPSYAHVRSAAASAAYLAASGADTLFASRNSDIGSIGVTMSYLDYSEQNREDGIIYQQISSGKYKDSGSAYKSLNDDERRLFQRDINLMADNFIQQVAENRGLSVGTVQKLADGSTMLGEAALQAGLIDHIGVMNDVYDFIESDLGEEISICW